jgi:hypothetical protein
MANQPVIISTGDIRANYQVIDAIFAMDSHKEGTFKGADPGKAFEGVKDQLRKQCAKIGGNAVIFCQFEYRVAAEKHMIGGSSQVAEIFAYGTAVKF